MSFAQEEVNRAKPHECFELRKPAQQFQRRVTRRPNVEGDGYQFMQARRAMGSGGLTGSGLCGGHQAVLLLFAILVWRGNRAAVGARAVSAAPS